MRAKIVNGVVTAFPYTQKHLIADQGWTIPPSITERRWLDAGAVLVVEAPQPAVTTTQIAERNALPDLIEGEWVLGWTVREREAGELDAIRDNHHAALADYRYIIETGGITLPDGRVYTDRTSQSMIDSAVSTLERGYVTSAQFKGADGWTTVDTAAITAIAQAVAQHVQSCFAAERVVSEQIDALSDAELVPFDPIAAFDAALAGGTT